MNEIYFATILIYNGFKAANLWANIESFIPKVLRVVFWSNL